MSLLKDIDNISGIIGDINRYRFLKSPNYGFLENMIMGSSSKKLAKL